MLSRSPTVAFSETGSVVLSAGTDSPVSAASSVRRFLTSASRRSAGTLSPDSSSTTSPGTSSSAGSMRVAPPRRVRASADSMLRIESSAFSALPSWMNPSSALMTTTAEDDRGVDPQAEHHLGEAGAEQHVDQDVVELGSQAHERPPLPAFRQAVGSVLLQAGGGFAGVQAVRGAGAEAPQRLLDGNGVPGGTVGRGLGAHCNRHRLLPVAFDPPRCPKDGRSGPLGSEASAQKHSDALPTSRHSKLAGRTCNIFGLAAVYVSVRGRRAAAAFRRARRPSSSATRCAARW